MIKRLSAIPLVLGLQAVVAQDLASIPEGTQDWGCEVLLCLANPNGPTAVEECVPPIERLWHELARGHAFPTCAMASGPNGRSHALSTRRYYDRCPDGTTALAADGLAMLARPMRATAAPPTRSGAPSGFVAAAARAIYTGIGDADGFNRPGDRGALPGKVCVANRRGTTQVGSGDDGVTVDLYDTVYVAPAHVSPRVIDVYVDGAYWQSVRW